MCVPKTKRQRLQTEKIKGVQFTEEEMKRFMIQACDEAWLDVKVSFLITANVVRLAMLCFISLGCLHFRSLRCPSDG